MRYSHRLNQQSTPFLTIPASLGFLSANLSSATDSAKCLGDSDAALGDLLLRNHMRMKRWIQLSKCEMDGRCSGHSTRARNLADFLFLPLRQLRNNSHSTHNSDLRTMRQ